MHEAWGNYIVVLLIFGATVFNVIYDILEGWISPFKEFNIFGLCFFSVMVLIAARSTIERVAEHSFTAKDDHP